MKVLKKIYAWELLGANVLKQYQKFIAQNPLEREYNCLEVGAANANCQLTFNILSTCEMSVKFGAICQLSAW